MSRAADNFLTGARLARQLAAECLEEAKTADTERAFKLIADHDRAIERAEWYESHAALFATKTKLEIAA